jgi:hypothetical protein
LSGIVQHTLFYILHLFADFFHLFLGLDDEMTNGHVICLCADRVDLALHLLEEKVHPLPNRLGQAEEIGERPEVALEPDVFLSDITLLGQTRHILQNATALRVELGQKRADLVCQFPARGLLGVGAAPPDASTYFFEGCNPPAKIALQKFPFASAVSLQRAEGPLQRFL